MKPKKSKLRKSAKGQECTVRIPQICNFDPDTSVLAHVSGGGMGRKQEDHKAAIACSACHDVLDGRVKTEYPNTTIQLWHWQGVGRTWDIWIEQGLIEVDS